VCSGGLGFELMDGCFLHPNFFFVVYNKQTEKFMIWLISFGLGYSYNLLNVSALWISVGQF
jgi:hypothetical protein